MQKKTIAHLTASTIALVAALLVVPASNAETDNTQDDRPMIGINMDVEAGTPNTYRIVPAYVDAITKAGGIPVMIPPMPEEQVSELVSRLDGVMMIGGNDYPPALYKQEPHKSVVPMEEARHTFDMVLVKEVLKNGKIPFLGICAGCQALNIGSGGSLIQDIPSHYTDSKVKHSSEKGWQVGFNKHIVKPEDGTIISTLIGKDGLNVVTSHHQCVDQVGEGLRIAARTEDGVIESIESSKDKNFVVGVQWHPERDFDSNQALFKEFIKRGQEARQSKTQGRLNATAPNVSQ